MLLRALGCLPRYIFGCLRSKKFPSRFYVFRSALLSVSVFYATYLYFQPFRKVFRRVLPIFLFQPGTGRQRAHLTHSVRVMQLMVVPLVVGMVGVLEVTPWFLVEDPPRGNIIGLRFEV